MLTRSSTKNLEKNKSQNQNKRMNNEVQKTANKKLKLKAENKTVKNKSAHFSNPKKKENRQIVSVSAAVLSESSGPSNYVINKTTESCNYKSSIKVTLPHNLLYSSEDALLTVMGFDQRFQHNGPSLPVNLLSQPGSSNNSNNMVDMYTQTCMPDQPDSVYSMPPHTVLTLPNLPFHIMSSVSSSASATFPINPRKCSKIIDFSASMYNEDVVTVEKPIECVICLEDMDRGHKIARLQCLCIYHKSCIDLWFNKNVWCPSHPPT